MQPTQPTLYRVLTAGAVAASAAMPAAALTLADVACGAGSTTPGYVDCTGAFAGNDLGNPAGPAEVGPQGAAWSRSGHAPVGSSDGDGNGPLRVNPGGSSGMPTFDATLGGSFAVALQTTNAVRVHPFDGGTGSTGTLGVSVSQRGVARGLSPATLHGGEAPAPQPERHALMLAGLAAVVSVARRRRAGA